MKLVKFFAIILLLHNFTNNAAAFQNNNKKVRDGFNRVKIIAYPENARPVNFTVAEELKNCLSAGAEIISFRSGQNISEKSILKIAVSDDSFTESPGKVEGDKDWLYLKIKSTGDGEIVVSRPHLLYALFCLIKEDWINRDISEFENGKLVKAGFKWITGKDGFYGMRKRFTRGFKPEETIREIARMGCSHIIVNALSQPTPLEIGPPGEIYYRYYVSGPDLDQFVYTDLNKGVYPPEYLNANLNFLKKEAALAVKYGLTPGMHICNPRSVPESLLLKYPFLRGARIDHTFRSFRPRYTLTLGHPAVRMHYAEMLRKILEAVPSLGFISTWLNDSGSGFEYTTRLYPGRNGGPYIIREWKTDKEVAEAAASNVIRYYRLLRDTAHKLNPGFRIITNMRAIAEEEDAIFKGMDNGIDLLVSPNDKNRPEKWKKETAILEKGSFFFTNVSARGSYILGIPAPWLTDERLKSMLDGGFNRVIASFDPECFAPYDINREILRAHQLNPGFEISKIIKNAAEKWAGNKNAGRLIKIWEHLDKAVRAFPGLPYYDTLGIEWNQLWARPYVPDMEKIPEKEREYYEKYLGATFNNPHRVDLNADCLWEVISIEQGDIIVKECDTKVWKELNIAIKMAGAAAGEAGSFANVFIDIRDRTRGLKCFYRTMRNTAAWISGVHGYLKAKNDNQKKFRLKMVRDMVEDELQNTKDLLKLWESTDVDIIPVFGPGQTWFQYGEDLGDFLKERIRLTEKYKNHLPYIDPDYMWRMPKDYPVKKEDYLKY